MNIWIPQNKSPEIELLISFLCSLLLRCYFMMQHQPIVKRVNVTHVWAHRPYQPYQLLSIAACTNTGGQMKGSHPRPADRCPFVLRHSISQVTSFMQLGMLWFPAHAQPAILRIWQEAHGYWRQSASHSNASVVLVTGIYFKMYD